MIQADRLRVLMGPCPTYGRIKCNVGKGGSWGEFWKDAGFKLQGVEEHLQEWQQHAEAQRNLTGGRMERSPGIEDAVLKEG